MTTIPRPVSRRAFLSGAAAASLLALSGCGESMVPFETETPPVLLTPVTRAGVRDARARFREIFTALDGDHGTSLPDRLPAEQALWKVGEEAASRGRPVATGKPGRRFHLLLVSGFGAQCFEGWVRAFEDAEDHLRALGHRITHARLTAFGSVAQNAERIAAEIAALDVGEGEELVVLGYSKGVPDALEAFVRHPELARRVRAFISLAGAVNGSPLAEVVPGWIEEFADLLPGVQCDFGDGRGLEDLRPRVRLAAVARFPQPPPVPVYSLVAFVPGEEVSAILRPFWHRLAAADPRNDGQLLWYDQILPGSTLLAYLRGDHLAVGVPVVWKLPWLAHQFDHNRYPRALMLEAALRFLEEELTAAAAG